jgi:predicted DNA-binding protein YlxM (UPF0122 family)
MIPQYNEHRADVRSAYNNMLMQEASDSHTKKVHKAVTDFIKKNKSAFKDYNGAIKIANMIPQKSEDVDIIGLIADLSNTMKDSKTHEKDLDKLIDMV